jgi:lipid II:glycine glycyltransferase (peptidoglycan interpeptide bridge formation enzyme)
MLPGDIGRQARWCSDHKRTGYTRFKRSPAVQVKQHAGTWDLPIHALKYSLYRAAKTFSNTYI